MKKRLAVGGVVLSLLAILGIGTAAYFVTDGRAENQIVTGKVELTLTETVDGQVVDETGHQLDGVMPGQTVEQVASIQNTGNQPYWLRVRANVNMQAKNPDATLDNSMISFNWDTTKWTLEDGWYYYNEAVDDGQTVNPFTEVTFDAAAGNEYQGCTIDITVEAQAVQVKNNLIPDGGSVVDVQGWPDNAATVTP